MELISGDVEPLRAGTDAVVPLWMATMLRRRKLCKIVPPPWMDAAVLRDVLRFERDLREQSFSPELPFRHAEIARALLSACRAGSGTGSAAGDAGGDAEIPDADAIKILLEDIASVRMDKIRRNVHQLSQSTLRKAGGRTESVIDVTNIGSLEMHAIKPFVTESFRLHREMGGRGTSYGRDVEPDASAGGGGSAAAASAGRGRLRTSRLASRQSENNAQEGGEEEEVEAEEHEEEELMEPRPMEEMEGDEMMEEMGEGGEVDANAGRSALRRHR